MNPLSTKFAACTIIAKNYLPFARVLANSWHNFHPDSPLFVLLLDSPAGCFSPAEERFETVLISELGIPNLAGVLFKYSILEGSTAVKPFFLLHLFKSYGIEKLLYLDPDILVLHSLDSLNAHLEGSNAILTPHLTKPLPCDQGTPSDHGILQSGTYNLGFLGLRDGQVTRTLLDWWREKLYHQCIVSFERNLFVDQRWMDLVPGLFAGVKICRHPGYNIAYWNLHERKVKIRDGVVCVNNEPAYFFHFSGFNPDEPERISKYQNRFEMMSDIGDARHLYEIYRQSLLDNGWDEAKKWKYDHDFFDIGIPISSAMRKYYWDLGPDVEHLGDPFTWLDDVETMNPRGAAGRTNLPRLSCGVNVMGYFNSEKGVGEGARSNLRIVQAAGLSYVANNIVDSGSLNAESLPQAFSAGNPYSVNLITVNADQFATFAESRRSYMKGHFNIGYWAWELPEFPPEWAAAFEHVDEVWTPSQFTRDSVAAASPVPVRVLSHAIDPQLNVGLTGQRSRFGIPSSSYIFLFFFDFHSSMERKNPLGLIHAYKRAFGARTDVQLLIKCSHSSQHRDEAHMLQETARGANVRILDEVLSRNATHELMMASDCYISLHRSEGFGLTMAEAMLCGKPVIATGYSGNVDYMTPETSFLVPYKLVVLNQTHGPYRAGYHWAQPDLDCATDMMRHVLMHREAATDLGLQGREHVWRSLHPTSIAKSLLGRLHELGIGNLKGLLSKLEK